MNQFSLAPLANFGSAVPWGLWVGVYIWLVGISAGSFLLISWGNLTNNLCLKKLSRLGITLALATLSAGLLSILIDLGHIERFYKLFISPNPVSVMAWIVWLYNIYFVILAVSLFRLKKAMPKLFLKFGFMFALLLIVMESLLFAQPPGKIWHSPIFVLHFISSSLVSAIAAMILLVGIIWSKSEKGELLNGLSKIALSLVSINLVVEIFASIEGVGHPVAWIMISANVAAIILLLKRRTAAITSAGIIGLINVFVSKYDSVVSAQLSEPFRGFGGAFIEPRLSFSYTPTPFEWLIAVSLVCLAAFLFYILNKLLPLIIKEGGR